MLDIDKAYENLNHPEGLFFGISLSDDPKKNPLKFARNKAVRKIYKKMVIEIMNEIPRNIKHKDEAERYLRYANARAGGMDWFVIRKYIPL